MFGFFKKKKRTYARRSPDQASKKKAPPRPTPPSKGSMTLPAMAKKIGVTYNHLYMHAQVGTLKTVNHKSTLWVEPAEYNSFLEWQTSPKKLFEGRELYPAEDARPRR